MNNQFDNFNNFEEEEKKGNKKSNTDLKIKDIKKELENVRNEIDILKNKKDKSTNEEIKMYDMKIKENELLTALDKINYSSRNRRRKKAINNLKIKKERLEFKIWKEKNISKDSSFNF